MDKDKVELLVARKNAQIVMQTLEQQNVRIADQQRIIEVLSATVASLETRLHKLEQSAQLAQAMAIGRGATSLRG